MDSNTVDASHDAGTPRRRRGKSVDNTASAKWTEANIAALIEACAKEVRAGSRPGGTFDHAGWVHVREEFNLKTSNNYTKQQLKNRLDSLKISWKDWQLLNRGETGLGWDSLLQTVSASPDWWSRKIQENRAVAKFRRKGPLLKELQAEIFEGVATGSRAFAPSSGNLPVIDSTNSEGSGETIPEGIVHPQGNIATTPLDSEEAPMVTPPNRSSIIAKKQKRLRSAESIAKSLDTIAQNGRMRVEQRAACMPANEHAACINSLHALPGIAHGSKLWFFALELLMDPSHRIVYETLPTNDLRLTWLEEKWAKDKLINPSLYPSLDRY